MEKRTIEIIKALPQTRVKHWGAGVALNPVAPGADARSEGEADGKRRLVTFFLDSTEYALDAVSAIEAIKYRRPTEVPRTPECLKGILSVRGELVAIYDLRRLVGRGRAAEGPLARILLVCSGDLRFGVLVDRMGGVKDVPEKDIDTGAKCDHLSGAFENGGGRVQILDAAWLLRAIRS